MSWALRWEHAINQQVIGKPDQFAELQFEALLRADTKTQHEAMRIAIGRPWMSGNEGRRLLNLPPKEGLDEVITPKNVEAAPDGTANREGGGDES